MSAASELWNEFLFDVNSEKRTLTHQRISDKTRAVETRVFKYLYCIECRRAFTLSVSSFGGVARSKCRHVNSAKKFSRDLQPLRFTDSSDSHRRQAVRLNMHMLHKEGNIFLKMQLFCESENSHIAIVSLGSQKIEQTHSYE